MPDKKHSIEHIWSIAAGSSIIDQSNNNVSLMNIIEQFNVAMPPAHVQEKIRIAYPFDIVTLWQRSGDNAEGLSAESRVRFVDWKGDKLMEGSYKIEIPKGKKRGRAISKFPGVEINGIGNHKFLIELKEPEDADYRIVGEIPIEIKSI